MIFFTFFCILFSAQAQEGPKILGSSYYLDFPDGRSTIPYDVKTVDDKTPWIVCSDRSNNKTYRDEQGKVENDKVMDYMQRFYVSEEKSNFLHLYLYEDNIKVGGSKLALKSTAKDYGWAPKDKLLLWLRSMVNVGDRTAKKALPVLKDNTLGNASDKYVKNGLALIFSDPGLTQENNNAIKIFQFLFVYKEDTVNNSLLIGKSYESNFFRIQNDVLGWISKEIVQNWDNRICIEPNWDHDAVEERKLNNIKSSVFANKRDAISWVKSNGVPNAVWDKDTYEEREPRTLKIMPVLDSFITDGIIKTGYWKEEVNDTANSFFFIPGFTSQRINKLSFPVFNKVLFVSDGELDDLKYNLKKLTITGTTSSLRDKITDAYTSLIATFAGDKNIKELVARYTPSDVLNFVVGLPTNNKLLKKYKILDFKREDIVSDDDIFRIQNYLQIKYESISSVVGDPERMLRLDSGTFYWIEEDLLP